jgi:hypothetical protein
MVQLLNPEIESGPWIWMATSRVTQAVAWETRQDPVFQFAQAIRAAIKRGSLKVFRLYAIDEPAPEIAQKRASDLYESHLKNEIRAGVNIRINSKPGSIGDLSLIWRPIQSDRDDMIFSPSPTENWEETVSRGWEVLFGLEWDIRDSVIVEKVTLYPGTDSWVKWNHELLHRLWEKGSEVGDGAQNSRVAS